MKFFAALTTLAALAAPLLAAPYALAPRDDSSLASITDAVASLKQSVTSGVQEIVGTTLADTSTSIVPAVETSLEVIAASLAQTTTQIAAAVVDGIVVPLASGELQGLTADVGIVVGVVGDIKQMLEGLVGGVCDDAKSALSTEISTLLALVQPLVQPLSAFAAAVAGTLEAGALESGLLAGVADLEGVTGNLLSPVGGVLGGLGL